MLVLNVRLICEIFGTSETCYRHRPKLPDENEGIADWLLRLTTANKCLGCVEYCFDHIRDVKKFSWNQRTVYHIYCGIDLNLRIKPKRRIKRDKPNALRGRSP